MSQPPLDPASPLARLATIDIARNGLDDVLTRIVVLARDAVVPAAEASITFTRGGDGMTAAFTGDTAMALDERQYELGNGPCLAAGESGEVLRVQDAVTERRWPDFTPRCVELGVRSSASVPLPVQDVVTGAINFYAAAPGAFGDAVVREATTFAEHAAVAVSNARSYGNAATLIEQMRRAARTRSAIDQAKGLLAGRHGIGVGAALDVLILAAQECGRGLGDVADALVPATGSPIDPVIDPVIDSAAADLARLVPLVVEEVRGR